MRKIILALAGALSIAALSAAQAQTVTITPVASGEVKVTQWAKIILKIDQPRALTHQQKQMHQIRNVTIGDKNLRLPAEVNSVTVEHKVNLGTRKITDLNIAYNGSACPIEISGRPLQYSTRKVSIYIGSQKMPNGMLMGYCKKAVITGVKN